MDPKDSVIMRLACSYNLCKSFDHFVKHWPGNKLLNLSLQNEIDVLAYFTLTC